MVIRGRARGGAKHLSNYLQKKGENEEVELLSIDGTATRSLDMALLEMELNASASRSRKALYHAQINPDIKASQNMTPEQWEKAADILGKELGFDSQSRAIVLHKKKGEDGEIRTHAHVVWQRYDTDNKKLISDSHNFQKHDRAREKIEKKLHHKRTPQKGDERQLVTDLFTNSKTGEEFAKAMEAQGFSMYEANDGKRSRFHYINDKGEDKNLVRTFYGIKTKEFRDKMTGHQFMNKGEAESIGKARANQSGIDNVGNSMIAKRDQFKLDEQSEKMKSSVAKMRVHRAKVELLKGYVAKKEKERSESLKRSEAFKKASKGLGNNNKSKKKLGLKLKLKK